MYTVILPCVYSYPTLCIQLSHPLYINFRSYFPLDLNCKRTCWYNSHILIDSRLHWVDYEWNLIIKWLDDNKIRYIIETGKDEVYWDSVGELTEREFKAIIIANDNFTDYDLLSRDSGKLSRDA